MHVKCSLKNHQLSAAIDYINKYVCLDQKNWNTHRSANQQELRWQAATNHNLPWINVAQKGNQIRIMKHKHVEMCNPCSTHVL